MATPAALAECAAHLEACSEVAVDLEHHGLRSYLGLTCLLQLSSRTRDFLVDALALRSELGAALGPLFADPEVSAAI